MKAEKLEDVQIIEDTLSDWIRWLSRPSGHKVQRQNAASSYGEKLRLARLNLGASDSGEKQRVFITYKWSVDSIRTCWCPSSKEPPIRAVYNLEIHQRLVGSNNAQIILILLKNWAFSKTTLYIKLALNQKILKRKA